MGSPFVSVVMSVFKGQGFLSEAIESIPGQTFRDFEFLFIDDGSTAATNVLLSAPASRDSTMGVFRHALRSSVYSHLCGKKSRASGGWGQWIPGEGADKELLDEARSRAWDGRGRLMHVGSTATDARQWVLKDPAEDFVREFLTSVGRANAR
jgi:glycosyltransferase involved in cell wall biosynthesis